MRQVALPEALQAQVDAWLLDFDLAAPVADTDWSILARDEAERALRFARHEDRVRYVSTRATLRRLLSARLGRRPQDLRFLTSRQGKPRLAQPCGSDVRVEFNVSHAGAHGLVAISGGRAVGVDIERSDPSLDIASLEQQVLSPAERQQDGASRLDFLERWVVKEAVLKASGAGIGSHLQRLSVERPPAEGGGRYGLRYEEPLQPSLAAWRLDAPPGYMAAIAFEIE
ncbi:4'-phosphopantetheinyl transferase family protein [Pseudoduganella sp. HUAS MS19]